LSNKVVVIGGGIGALSGAIRLAKMGFQVELFEKNSKLGGKMNEYENFGYRFDTGPSLLTMPYVIDELFEFVGLNRSDLLEFLSLDPICRYFFPDGTTLDTSSNREKMVRAIDNFSPGQGAAYQNFLNYAQRIYQLTADIFLFTPIHELQKLLKRNYLSTLLQLNQIDPIRTVHQSVKSFFSDHRLIQLFDRYATYNGSNPFKAPATLNIIPYVEFGLGGFYIQGGMYRLVEVLESIALKVGVKIHTNTPAEKILHDQTKINGVSVNRTVIPTNYVLCGVDITVAYNQLIDGKPRRKKYLNQLESSLSGMVFMWGIGKKSTNLSHHNIVFSSNYQLEFDQIFEDQVAPKDPTIYIAITSKTDLGHAPSRGENWFVMLNMPYLNNQQDWKAETARMRSTILAKLQTLGLDITNHIEVEKVHTPEDYYSIYGSHRGSIYGISSNSRSAAFRRPANRSRNLKGLYFAGGSSHPGGGIPLVILSGKMAAELIAEAEKII